MYNSNYRIKIQQRHELTYVSDVRKQSDKSYFLKQTYQKIKNNWAKAKLPRGKTPKLHVTFKNIYISNSISKKL